MRTATKLRAVAIAAIAASSIALAAGPAAADTIPIGSTWEEGHASVGGCETTLEIYHEGHARYWAYGWAHSFKSGWVCRATASNDHGSSSSSGWNYYSAGNWNKSGGVWDGQNYLAWSCVEAVYSPNGYSTGACTGSY
ncbi:hypothetical protein [Kitasatospora sp. GP82]|uniref:hypothetical protein n=1 Tax=Kitasatospora sp. GP82 TaxID=3035089 RepID=UPI002474B763|nr:hypothetical protein [Kitasatospora sp. GP82]MDH6130072.1 hypothetical protein [Kitasatospora sp. GP82]